MLTILSPAKTLDDAPIQLKTYTEPRLLRETEKLARLLSKMSPEEISALMKVSEKIAQLNFERFQSFKTPFIIPQTKQSMFMFKGDVFIGLEASSFIPKEVDFAQTHLRFLSGFYGILRPLDLMHPYRLEMGTRLAVAQNNNLYQFWGNKITDLINADIENSGSKILLNLASKEYFKAVNTKKLAGKLVNIYFKENRDGKYKIIAFNAKKARGAMARQVIKYQIQDEEGLKSLLVNDYIYNEKMSEPGELVFTLD